MRAPVESCGYAVSVTHACTTDVERPAQRRAVAALVLSSQQLHARSPHIGAEDHRPKSRDMLCRVCRILMQITSRSSSTDRRGCICSVESQVVQVVLVRIVHGGRTEARDRQSGAIYFWGRMNSLEGSQRPEPSRRSRRGARRDKVPLGRGCHAMLWLLHYLVSIRDDLHSHLCL